MHVLGKDKGFTTDLTSKAVSLSTDNPVGLHMLHPSLRVSEKVEE